MTIDQQLQSTSTLRGQVPWTAWFLFGATGSGKTTIAATFPDPLFLVPANENSFVTLLDHKQEYSYLTLGKDASTGEPVKARQHMEQVLDWLDARYRRACAGDAQAFPWQTIVVESLTHYTDLVVEDLSDFGKKQMDQAKWGHLSGHLRMIHDRLRSLDVHIVYTALATVKEVKGHDASVGLPNLTGQMAEKLPSACDVIGYCEALRGPKGDSTYRVNFRRTGPFQARSRFPRLPAFLDNFTFDDAQQYLG